MDLFAIFAITLMAAVLISGLANRSIVSTAVLFLAAGVIAGDGGLGLVHIGPTDPIVIGLAEIALFAVLFTDGMHATPKVLRDVWHLPGRALAIGFPVTFALGSVAAHYLAGLDWVHAFIVGAVLAPTDPVLAEAIVGRKEVPKRLRSLLNVESGLNDGLALPVVLVFVALASHGHLSFVHIGVEIVLGIAIGVAIPWVMLKLESSKLFGAEGRYQPLNAFAIGLLVFAAAKLTHANVFLAAFAAGITIATMSPQVRASFEHFGELVSELCKLAALMVFGALLSVSLFTGLGLGGWVLVVVLLLAVRPVALGLALPGKLDRREFVAASWFGPKGFGSATYGLMVLVSAAPEAQRVFELVAATIAVSIVAHASTDVLVARWFTGGDGSAGDAPEGTLLAGEPEPEPTR